MGKYRINRVAKSLQAQANSTPSAGKANISKQSPSTLSRHQIKAVRNPFP